MSILDEKPQIKTEAQIEAAQITSTTTTDSKEARIENVVVDGQPECPRDGGLRAWFQVLGGFLLWFNLWGYTFAYGSFQNYYVNDFLRGTSASSIAWIGSIQSFLLVVSSIYAGPLFDLGYFRSMTLAGALISTFGSFMLSLSTQYWHVFLAQGVCIGLGCGVLFVPCTALIARAFTRRRALAMGVMSCGAPVGSIIYTFIFEGLLEKNGFAWTARYMAFFMLGTYALAFPLLTWRVTNTGTIRGSTKRKLIDRAALTDLPFWSYALCLSAQFMAYLIPFFFMPNYAQVRLGTSFKQASSVLAIAQACSIPGRILASIAANYVGVMLPWTICAFVSGMMCLVWIAAKDLPSFIAFGALYGAFSGALIPLPPSMFPRLVDDHGVLGTRLGMAQSVTSIANMIGPPIGGALLRVNSSSDQNWLALQLFCGFVLIFASIQVCGLWSIVVRKKGHQLFV